MRYLIILMLAGCATTERFWVKPGASEQDFYMDRGQCQAQAAGVMGMNSLQMALAFSGCMQGKGWYTEERSIR